MKVESPDFMNIPFSKCWSLDHPIPDENQGRRLAERRRKAQHQYENSIVKPHKVMLGVYSSVELTVVMLCCSLFKQLLISKARLFVMSPLVLMV